MRRCSTTLTHEADPQPCAAPDSCSKGGAHTRSGGGTFDRAERSIAALAPIESPASQRTAPPVAPAIVYTGGVEPGAVIRAADVLEIRAATQELRAAAGLPPFSFTDPSLVGGRVRAVHLNELRTSIGEARISLGLSPQSYTDPTITPGSTRVKAAHVRELRAAVVFPGGASRLNPTPVQNLYAAGISPTAVFLKWSPSASPKVSGQPEGMIAGYRVFRDGLQIATVTDALRFEDSGRTPDTTYVYSVVAVDGSGRLSPAAVASATTLPDMPAATAASHPVLLPSDELASLAAGGAAWDAKKQFCDSNLTAIINPDYAGWGWHDAAISYGTCYQVAKMQGDTANAELYAKKTLALAIVLARHHNFGTPSGSDQPLGLTDGSKTTWTLPFTPMNAAQVTVRLVATRAIELTRSSEGSDALETFAPVMKVSSTAGGPPAFAASDYVLRYRDGYEVWRLAWPGANKPANGSTYFVTVADGAATTVASGFTVNAANLTITFAVPPAAGQAVMVSYLGSAYQQTGNGLGGVNGVQPDGPGYPMRTFNPGLATAYDALLDSLLLTPSIKAELYGVMNRQVDWCLNYCYENEGTGGNVGNYFIRGLLGGTLATAYATDGDNPLALQLKSQANTLLAQMIEGVVKYLPGGYGPQGQYANGTTNDILEFLSLYHRITGLDLASPLDWTTNVVPATIHATKPDLQSFYDGGDWDELPASPLITGMQGFLKYQEEHADAPFARKLVEEAGEVPVSSGTVTDYRASFPLSYFAQGSPFYARSDWGANAVWMALTSNDTGTVVHQHRDAGHFTIHRGSDYLLKDAGGYDYTETLYHNSFLIDDRNIAGYDPVLVYPPSQGWWGREAQLTRHGDEGSHAYVQADFAHAYVNNDGERNSVSRALRSIVYLRPNTFVVFDQIQVAHPQIRKTFNANFGGTLISQGAFRSTTVGQSKLFMQSLLSSATPVVSPLAGGNGLTSSNFQEATSGTSSSLFLHVFQATSDSVGAMTAGKAMKSVDRNVQGVEVAAGGRTWALLFAAYDRVFAGDVQYLLPSAGARSHLVHDLVPLNDYLVSVTTAQGQTLRTIRATTDRNGVLMFESLAGEAYFYVTPGTAVPLSIPPVTTDPNA
ncbi:MAG: heparinase II/III family protein [Acidobacteria bacterium]|nr:heparinase II/III family protein [Acidobacteriota bacterium]